MKKKQQDEKKIREAAALRYNQDVNSAPEIIALGKGVIADKILEMANKSHIPVYEDPKLARTLNQLNIGDEIPPELYEVAAQILAFVSSLDGRYGEMHGRNKK